MEPVSTSFFCLRNILWILGGLVAVGLVVFGIVLIVKALKKRKKEKTNATTPAPQPAPAPAPTP